MGINIFAIIMLAVLVFKIWDGYRKGMVKEIVSFISLVFLCLVAALMANGLSSYFDGKFLNVVVAVVLLALLSIAHHIINVVVFPAKLLAKLPVVHSLDKILGVAVGILESVLILWTIYTFVMMMDLGMIGEFIVQCTAENPILTWFYRYNQLAGWLQILSAELGTKLQISF